jgi:hypothetical protein
VELGSSKGRRCDHSRKVVNVNVKVNVKQVQFFGIVSIVSRKSNIGNCV